MTTRLRVGALVVVLVVATGAFVVPVPAGADPNPNPTHWDKRIAPIAAATAKIRRLEFDHPVPVHFLPPAKFRKRVASVSKPTRAERRSLARATAQLRAVGLISGDPNLDDEAATARGASALAFYDPKAKEVFVRGTGPLDPAHKVTLAHELTHVLQDQAFDLRSIERKADTARDQAPEALLALIEGDAVRVENKYHDSLSKADQARADDAAAAETDRAETESGAVPAIIQLELATPYVFGPVVLQMLTARRGNSEVNRAFHRSPFTQRLFVDPAVAFSRQQVVPVRDPRPGRGEKAVGRSRSFGALDLYLMLAARVDPPSAIKAARGWRGGRIISTKGPDGDCTRAVVAPKDRAARTAMVDRLKAWADTFPDGAVTVTDGRTVSFRACDPGPSADIPSPDAALEKAISTLALHAELEAGLASSGAPTERAGCVALALTSSPELRTLLDQPQDSVTQAQVSRALESAAPAARDECV